MNTDKFDELIKSKVEEAHFDFNPEHWEQASQLIDRERALHKNNPSNSKKYWSGLLLLLLSLSGIYAIFINSNSAKNISVQKNKTELGAGHLLAMANISESRDEKDQNVLSNNHSNGVSNSTAQDKINEIYNEQSKNSITDASDNQSLNKELFHGKTSDKSGIVNSNIKSIGNEFVTKDEEEDGSIKMNNNAYVADNTSETIQAGASQEIKDLYQDLASGSIFLPNLTPKFSNNFESQYNNNDNLLRTSYIAIKKDDDYYRDKKPKKQFLNIEANSFYNQGWSDLGDKKARGLNFNLGVNYGFYLSRFASASFGAHFYTIRQVNQTIYCDTVSSFNFGVNKTINSIVNNQLAYITIPLQVNFHINRKNYISTGINIGTKVYSRNTVITSDFIGEELTSTKKEHNNFNYFNVADRNMMLEASYTGNLAKRFWLKAGVFYGINDLFQQVNGIQNLKGINIGIKYEIFDK